jgi:hypothetical protein
MRFARSFVLVTLALSGCSGDSSQPLPTAPSFTQSPPLPTGQPGQRAWLWGMVVDKYGTCIEGAVVHVVSGQRAGESREQVTRCDVWDIVPGFQFDNLVPGVEMTLRATAPGYASKEQTFVPHSGPQTVVVIEPSRIE